MSIQSSDAGSWGRPSSIPRTPSPRTYDCSRSDVCDMKFNNLIDRDIHMHQRCHWRCSKCGTNFEDNAALEMHDLSAHPEPMDLSCPGCNEHFTRPGNLMQHIETGRCRLLKPELLHSRRKERQAFQDALRRLNPANELDFLDAMPDDGARPHTKPDSNFIDVVQDAEDYRVVSGPMCAKFRHGGSKAPDLLTGDNLEALNHVPRGENDTFSPWREPAEKAPRQDSYVAEDLKPEPLPAMQGRRIADPDHPDFNVAVFYNSVYERFACPYLRCNQEYKTSNALIKHLQSLTHKPDIKITCPDCGRMFNTMTAAINHAEARSRKCPLQYHTHFRQFVSQVSGCVLDISGEMLNGQPRFVVVKEAGELAFEGEARDGCEPLENQMARLRVEQPAAAPAKRR